MTTPRDALADAIDPRKNAAGEHQDYDDGGNLLVSVADLIAASDYIRASAAQIALMENSLSIVNVQIAAALRAPLPLSGDEWLERAARICDDAAERCRANEQEQYGRCNDAGADIWAIRAVQNTQRATAIRALKTTPPSSRKTTPTDGGEG